jgi:hypothetical protein
MWIISDGVDKIKGSMKKIVLFIGLGMLCTVLHSQTPYKPCLDGENVCWSILYAVMDGGLSTANLTTAEDIMINDVRYKTLDTFWGRCIRETEDAAQLYVYDVYTGREYLVSDLNMQVGDTFPAPDIWDWDWQYQDLVVEDVYIKNGLKYIQFENTLTYSDHKLVFIEGVGPNIGLFHLHGYTQVLNCFENQTWSYKNEEVPYPCGYQSPWDAIHAPDAKKEYRLRIDAHGIELELADDGAQLSIYDPQGNLYYAAEVAAEKAILIPTTSFPRGVYLLKISYKNKTNVRKIIL